MSRGGKKHKKKGKARAVTAKITDATTADVTEAAISMAAMTAAVTSDLTSAIMTTVTADITAALSDNIAREVETVVEKVVKDSVEATVKVALAEAVKAAEADVTAAVIAYVTSAVTMTIVADITATLSKSVAWAVESVAAKVVKESVEATVKIAVAEKVPAAMTAAGPLPLLSLPKERYNNQKVYASSLIRDVWRNSWMEIDPHYSGPIKEADENHQDCFAIDRMPLKLNPPPHIDLYRINHFATVVADSKVYFIGGQYINEDCDSYLNFYSDKIFIYHLISNKWEESPSRLNVARGYPHATVVGAGSGSGKFIYVFGGHNGKSPREGSEIIKQHWIEYSKLDGKSDLRWEFLPPTSAPPVSVFDRSNYECHFVYELGSQIVFFKQDRRCDFHSFNYVSKTWAPFNPNIRKDDMGYNVAVVDHLLFWRYHQDIYAYDLMKDQLVLKQRLNELKMKFVDPYVNGYWRDESWLVSLGDDVLLMIAWDHDYDTKTNLHLYKFQIVKLSSPSNDSKQDSSSLRLVQVGTGIFSPPDYNFDDVVLA